MKKLIKIMGARASVTIVLLIIILAVGFFAIDKISNQNKEDTSKAIENVLMKAAVQCYALEGSYPPDLAYLEDNYGIILDEELYFYFYEVQGSNIAPKVAVIKR